MCLMWAIIESNKDKDEKDQKVLNTDLIAKWYKNWLESNPFDIANTTYTALLPLLKEPYAYAAKNTAAKHNMNSLSNTSMMKLAPLAVWTSSLSSVEILKSVVIADVEFIHSNELVQLICYVYSASVNFLLNNPNDPDRALQAYEIAVQLTESELSVIDSTDSEMRTCLVCLMIARQLSEEHDNQQKQKNQVGIEDDEFLSQNYDCTEQMGFVKHAFILTFYFLLRADKRNNNFKGFFEYVLRQVI